MSDYTDPYLQQLLALQAQRQTFQPKAKYPGETDKFLSEQDQFYQSIGYDPLDYAMPANLQVEQYVNESGLPTVMVNGELAWIGESSARDYYEGSAEDDEYAALALDSMDMIDEGMSPLEARKWAQQQVAAAQEKNPEAFADMELADKVLGDVDKYGGDLNTRQSTVDRAIATKGAAADDFGMFKGGGQYSSGLGEDPFGYEKGQARGQFSDYQNALGAPGVDRAQIAKLLDTQFKQRVETDPQLNRDVHGAAGGKNVIGSGIASETARLLGANPKRDGLDDLLGHSSKLKNMGRFTQGPTDEDINVAAAVQAGKNLYSGDEGVRANARGAYQARQRDLQDRPNAGHQELLRRVMATRSAMGLEALPSRPGPVQKARPTYNPTPVKGRPTKVQKAAPKPKAEKPKPKK